MIRYTGNDSYEPEYFDKNGTPIIDGCKIKFPSGKIKEVFLADTGELGTDATNPLWVEDGRAYPCQYGIFTLTYEDTEEVEVVE